MCLHVLVFLSLTSNTILPWQFCVIRNLTCPIMTFLREYAFMFSDIFAFGQEFQRKLSQLTPEQKRLTEKLKNMTLNNLPGWY